RRHRGLVVLVEGRDLLQPVEQLELADVAEQNGVVRVAPQAAQDTEELHCRYAFTRWSSAVSVTSFASAGLPFGSGRFQLRPNWVRSTLVWSDRPMRSLPNASSIGSAIVPVSLTGCVLSLIVSSPFTVTSSPSRTMSVAE